MQRLLCVVIVNLLVVGLMAQKQGGAPERGSARERSLAPEGARSAVVDGVMPLRERGWVTGVRVDGRVLAARMRSERLHVVVEMPVEVNTGTRAAMRLDGVELLERLEGNRYYAAVDRRGLAAVSGSVFALRGEDKVSAHLLGAGSAPWASAEWGGRAAVDVAVLVFGDVSVAEMAGQVRGRGWGLLEEMEWQKRLLVRVPREELMALAELDGVRHVQAIAPPVVEHDNVWSAEMMRVGEMGAEGLTGKDVKVGIWDGGTVSPLPDFAGRLTMLESATRSAHATHVAGTLAGSGTTEAGVKGIAPGAQLFTGTYARDVFGKMRDAVGNNGVQISHNSWGLSIADSLGNCELFGEYSQEARVVDELVARENLVSVYSIGNPRSSGACGVTARAGYYSTSIPASAKNAIAVAAVDRDTSVGVFSGFGPTRDGRLKPDVTALGVNVRSLGLGGASGSTAVASGTSMSAPAVSGLLALMTERFQTKQGEAKPKASLLKAVMLNTARDLGNPGPDYVYGYGVPQAPAAMKVIDEKQYVLAKLTEGEARHAITVPAGSGALRVMLAWTDVAGTPETANSLVNDLDLSVGQGDGAAVLPFTLDPRNPSADARRAANRRDNVEQVVIANPAGGEYVAVVRAARGLDGEQEYALTWTFEPVEAAPCVATLTSTLLNVGEQGGTIPLTVTQANHCEATDVENPADWVETSVVGKMKGSGVLKLRLKPNQERQSRSTLLRIAGRELRVNQSGPCAVEKLPQSLEVRERLGVLDCIYVGSRAKLYTFDAKAGQTIAIEMRSEDFDSYLELLAPNRTLIAWDDDSLGGVDSRLPGPTGRFRLPFTGTYTIVATSYVLREGAFTMKVEFGADQEAPPAEAYPKQIGGCPFSGQGQLTESSSAEGRRGSLYRTDAYVVQAFAGQRLDVIVSEAAFDSYVYLISPTGSVLAVNDDLIGQGGSRITETIPVGGQWRIEVTSFAPFQLGTYKLEVMGCPAVAK